MTNWNLFSKIIKDAGFTESSLSIAVGRSHGWLHLKRLRGNDFTNGDISKMCEVLNMDFSSREAVFFARNVD